MEIRVEIVDGRIAARPFPPQRFPGDYEMSKSIPGHRWHKEGAYWHYPLNMVTCRTLREVYSDMLRIGPDLTAWAREEISRSEAMAKFTARQDAALHRVPDVAPALDKAMASRTYQRVGARFIAMNRSVLLADEPSLGKTIQYLAGLVEASAETGSHLVIAPKSSLYSTWASEIKKWTDWHPFWMPDGRPKRERTLDLFLNDEHPSKFLIVNPEMLQTKMGRWCKVCEKYGEGRRKDEFPMDHYTEGHKDPVAKIEKQDWPQLFDVEWASICIDEAHLSLLGNRGGKKTQTAEGLTRLKVRPDAIRIASTGTPLKGKALNFWSTFNWLDPEAYSSKWAFAEAFLDIKDNGFGKVIGDIRPEREQALYESLRPLMLRRTKKEVQPDLPDDVYVDHWVEMPPAQAKQYNELVNEGETEIEGGNMSTNGLLSEYTARKRFAFGAMKRASDKLVPDPKNSPKLDLLVQMLDERGLGLAGNDTFKMDGGFKYIIVSQFTQTLDFLEQHLSVPVFKITGSVTGKKRQQVLESFQEDPDGPRVLLVNTKAGGTSLTLDAMCDEMFILDETWTRDDQFQVEGRIKNRSVEKRIATRYFHYIRTRGTIEEEIAESGLTQDEFQKTILDRSRGLKIEKRSIAS